MSKIVTDGWIYTKPQSEWSTGSMFLAVVVSYEGKRRARASEYIAVAKCCSSLGTVQAIGRSKTVIVRGRPMTVTVIGDKHV